MNVQIYDEASEWLIELQTSESDPFTRARFHDWLNVSPQHVQAYLELMCLWEDASDIDKRHARDVDALIASGKDDSNVRTLEQFLPLHARHARGGVTAHGPWSPPETRTRPGRFLTVAAAAIVLGLGTIGAWYWNANLRGIYSTDIREQRTLALADGTTVELNAGTRIRERFSKSERVVDLLQGQALFRVAKIPSRPFIVRSSSASVRAIGTQFDVNQRATGTTITVVDGRVSVALRPKGDTSPRVSASKTPAALVDSASTSDDSPRLETRAGRVARAETVLGAGQQLSVQKGQPAKDPEKVDVGAAIAWTDQRLVFERTNLSDAAEEFNRFNARKIIVDPDGIEDFRVNGTFPALDPESLPRFLRFLQDQRGLTVVETKEQITVAKK